MGKPRILMPHNRCGNQGRLVGDPYPSIRHAGYGEWPSGTGAGRPIFQMLRLAPGLAAAEQGLMQLDARPRRRADEMGIGRQRGFEPAVQCDLVHFMQRPVDQARQRAFDHDAAAGEAAHQVADG